MNKLDKSQLKSKPSTWIATTILFTNIFFVIVISLSYWRFGSVSSGIVYLKGGSLVLDKAEKSFGELKYGDERAMTFDLTNLRGNAVTIHGVQSSCTCTVAENIPLVIPPYEKRRLTIRVLATTKEGELNKMMRLYTDDAQQSVLTIKVRGHVVRDKTHTPLKSEGNEQNGMEHKP